MTFPNLWRFLFIEGLIKGTSYILLSLSLFFLAADFIFGHINLSGSPLLDQGSWLRLFFEMLPESLALCSIGGVMVGFVQWKVCGNRTT